jgi:hypothetical protein
VVPDTRTARDCGTNEFLAYGFEAQEAGTRLAAVRQANAASAAPALLRELARSIGGAAAPRKFGVRKLVTLIKWRYEALGIDVPDSAKGTEANRGLLAALWGAHAPADLEAAATEAEEAAGSVAGASSSAARGGGGDDDDSDGEDEDGDEEEDALAMDVAELARRGGVDETGDPVVDDDDDDDDDSDGDGDVGVSSAGSHASGDSRSAIDGACGAFGAIVTAGGGDGDGSEATEARGASSQHTTAAERAASSATADATAAAVDAAAARSSTARGKRAAAVSAAGPSPPKRPRSRR